MTDEPKQEMVVTPWEVKGDIDYDKLIEQFGVSRLTPEIEDKIAEHAGFKHLQLRRGVYLSHRDTDWWLKEYEKGNKVGLYTGRGPSGNVHLGHLVPWFFCAYLQEAFDADMYFQMTDDEKFLHRSELSIEEAVGFTYENALDVIACGLKPGKTHIISDTNNIEHLYRIAIRVAKRVTFNTAKAVFGLTESDNIGKIWFPAMQASPSFIQSVREGKNIPCLIPAAIDQDPYWRMTRDIAEKMGYYKPAQIHAKFLPGLAEGGKMSASQPDTAIFTTDPPKKAGKKVMKAFTGGRDTVEEQKELGGRPEICNVYAYYYFLFENDDKALVEREMLCKKGEILCGQCKKELAGRVEAFLTDFQEKREKAREVLDEYFIKPVE